MPAGWTATATIGVSEVVVDATGPALSLPADGGDLVTFTASVPDAAPYATGEALQLHNVLVGGVAGIGATAIKKVAYFGDANGDGMLLGSDTVLIARVAAGRETGFDAYVLTDPRIIADADGDGAITQNDATMLSQHNVLMSQPAIPDLPSPPLTLVTGGLDPVVSVASGVTAQAGSAVEVPVTIDGPADAAVRSIALEFSYDTQTLSLSSSDVKLAGLTSQGWNLLVNANDSQGTIYVNATSSTPLAAGSGAILNLEFQVSADAAPGTSVITVAAAAVAGGGLNGGALTLTPQNGSITVLSQAQVVEVAALPTATVQLLVAQPPAVLPEVQAPAVEQPPVVRPATAGAAVAVNTAHDAVLADLAGGAPAEKSAAAESLDGLYEYAWLMKITQKAKDTKDLLDDVFADFGKGS